MRVAYVRFAPLTNASVQEGLTRAPASTQVGGNGWSVMVARFTRQEEIVPSDESVTFSAVALNDRKL